MAHSGSAKTKPAKASKVIDLSGLPAPSLAGFADGCAIIERIDVLEFVFFDSRMRLQIVRMMALLTDMASHFWANSESFFQALAEAPDRRLWGSYSVLAEVPKDLKPVDAPAPLVNIFPMARRGLVAQLDAYFIGPLPIHRQQQTGRKAEAVPLFSLQLPVGLLLKILEFVHERRPAWRERFEIATSVEEEANAI